MANAKQNNYNNEVEEESVDLKDLAYIFLAHWKLFAISLALCFLAALAYLHFTMPTYRVSSKIMIRDEKRGGGFFSEISVFDDIDMLYKANTENEVELLKSKSLVKNVILENGLYVDYYGKSFLKRRDISSVSPIVMVDSLFQPALLANGLEIEMKRRDDGSVRVKMERDGLLCLDTLFAGFPVEVNTPAGPLDFALAREWNSGDEFGTILVTVQPLIVKAKRYIKLLSLSQVSKNSSIVELLLHTTNKERGVIFLNGLIDIYNRQAVEEKNEVATKTALFIDNRIKVLTEELGETEKNLEKYKKREGLTELSSNAQLYLQKGTEYEQKRVECETQLNLVLSLKSYLMDEANQGNVIPSNIGISDVGLTNQINQYNNLLLARVKLMQTTSENNPVVAQQTMQINGLFENIKLLVANAEKGLNISLADLNRQAQKFRGQISNVPTQERLFVEIERQRQIQQQLFLLLLQKREENALTMAATLNCAKVVDESLAEDKPIAPKRTLVFFFALLFGMVIPALYIYLRRVFSFNLTDAYEMEQEGLTSLPLLAELPFKEEDLDEAQWQRVREEPFRLLRTNLQFLQKDKDSKVILVTSFVPNEGKTFVASNAAFSFASLSKRIVLVGADIRNPQIKRYFQQKAKYGLSNYLSNESVGVDDIIEHSDKANLDIISGGAVPPNPAELLSRTRLEDLFAELRRRYDYIIIDTAPVSVVTDTLILSRVADMTVFVCRSRYLNKRCFKYINALAQEKRLPDVGIVINAVRQSNQSPYGDKYGYGYGYGYGSGYGYGHTHGKESD